MTNKRIVTVEGDQPPVLVAEWDETTMSLTQGDDLILIGKTSVPVLIAVLSKARGVAPAKPAPAGHDWSEPGLFQDDGGFSRICRRCGQRQAATDQGWKNLMLDARSCEGSRP